MRHLSATPSHSITRTWAWRYSAFILLAMLVLGVLAARRAEQLLEREVELFLELEAAEILERLERPEAADLERLIDPLIDAASKDLKLTVQVFQSDGTLRYAGGYYADHPFDLDRSAAVGSEGNFRAEDVGKKYPYWIATARAGEEHVVQIGVYARSFVRRGRRIRYVFLAVAPVALLVSVGLGVLLARSSTRPVREMVASIRQIGAEQIDRRLPIRGSGDEFDQISESLNGMLDRVERGVQELRNYSAAAAHQLRTPLTALRGRLEVALEGAESAELRQLLSDLLQATTQLGDTVEAMLHLSRSSAGIDPALCEDVPIPPLLASVGEFFAPLAAQRQIRLRVSPGPACSVVGDPEWLRQLVVNLLENALLYAAPGAAVDVTQRVDGERVLLAVRDTGRGIPADQLELVFQPFRRVDPSGAQVGSGLGLPLARQIARAHGGDIAVESVPGVGSTFTAWLPIQSGRPAEIVRQAPAG